jgi:DNA-binding transcriptional ArsR family regulator
MAKPIKNLRQVTALAHPLRLRILEELAVAARTPKQVAEILGRKPTGLYHHVRVLEKARLVRQTETRRKRGTVEKYYRAVSPSVRVDPGVFERRRSRVPAILAGVLEAAEDDLRALRSPREPVLALRLRTRLTPRGLLALRRVLERFARDHEETAASEYSVSLVAFPTKKAAGILP